MSNETKTESSNFSHFGIGPLSSALMGIASMEAKTWSGAKINQAELEGWKVADQNTQSSQNLIAGGMFCEAKIKAAITFVRAKQGDDDKDKKTDKKKDNDKPGDKPDGDDGKNGPPKPDTPEPTHGKDIEQEENVDLADMLDAFEVDENYALDAQNAQDYFLHELPLVQDIDQQIEMALLGAELVPGNPAYTLPASSILQYSALNLPLNAPQHDLLSVTLDHLSNPNPVALAPQHHQALASMQNLDAPQITQFELDAPSFTMPDLNNFNLNELVNAPNMSADIASQAMAMDMQGGVMSQFQNNLDMTQPHHELDFAELDYAMSHEQTIGQPQSQHLNNPYFIQNTLNMAPAPNMSDPAFGGSGTAAGSSADSAGGSSGGDAGGGFSAS